MGSGLFGVADRKNCAEYLFYGTDYHTHMLDQGFAGWGWPGMRPEIHRLGQVREKFLDRYNRMKEKPRKYGIGVLSSHQQPFRCEGRHGIYTLCTVGNICNVEGIVRDLIKNGCSFTEIDNEGKPNPTEVVSKLVDQGSTFEEGIQIMHDTIEGSISLLIAKDEGIFAARSKYGHSPLVLGKTPGGFAVANETTAFYNLGIEPEKYLKPGEVIFFNEEEHETLRPGGDKLQVCPFLWIYTGFPSSYYEGKENELGINVEIVRENCGKSLASRDSTEADLVAGVPDSGTTHAIGYAMVSGIPFRRPLVKYTPSYGRSYTPSSQEIRDKVAEMKLTVVPQIVKGNRIVLCEDSIVRGNQLKNRTLKKLFEEEWRAKEVHVRPACPPLVFPCRYGRSTRTRDELAAQRAIRAIEERWL